jgi:hypothetical protein
MGYRQDVVVNCSPKVGPAATRYLLLNIYSDWVLFLLSLATFAVVLATRGLHTHAAALVTLVIAMGVVVVWTRVKYVRAAAAFLGIERRNARRIFIRTTSYERWTRQHEWSSRSGSRLSGF